MYPFEICYLFFILVNYLSPASSIMCYSCESLGSSDDCMTGKNMEKLECTDLNVPDQICTTILIYFKFENSSWWVTKRGCYQNASCKKILKYSTSHAQFTCEEKICNNDFCNSVSYKKKDFIQIERSVNVDDESKDNEIVSKVPSSATILHPELFLVILTFILIFLQKSF